MEILLKSPEAAALPPLAGIGALSLSGTECDGHSPVRFVFADESGMSVNESLIVVAAVIIHADTQWIPAERRIRSLINEYVAKEHRGGFVFHATDLYHGRGR